MHMARGHYLVPCPSPTSQSNSGGIEVHGPVGAYGWQRVFPTLTLMFRTEHCLHFQSGFSSISITLPFTEYSVEE